MKKSHSIPTARHEYKYLLFNIYLLVGLITACDNSDPVMPDDDRARTYPIENVQTFSAAPEGYLGKATDEADRVEKVTFRHKVEIRYSPVFTIINPLGGAGVEIGINGRHVTINSTVEGVEYELSGETPDGSLNISSEHKFKLVLNNAAVTNPAGPAISIQSRNRVFLVIPDNSESRLTDGQNYQPVAGDDPQGTLFSNGPLIFSGNGKLVVQGNYSHAIVSGDYIRNTGTQLKVTGAVRDAIHTHHAFIMDNGMLDLSATDDGIQCEEGHIVINGGEIIINSTGKGITASYDTDNRVDPYVTINGGKIIINTLDEGIESKSVMTLNGGTLEINAADDALNAGKFIYINGGWIYARSTENDGIDSNGPITITGGTVIAMGAGGPEGGIDCDRSTFTITGGIVVGIGGTTSPPTAQVSTQRSVILGGSVAGNLLAIIGNDGAEALTFLVPENHNTMLFSSPKLQANTTYSLFQGGMISSAETFHSLYLSGTYEPGTKTSVSFSTVNMVTQVGGSIGPDGR